MINFIFNLVNETKLYFLSKSGTKKKDISQKIKYIQLNRTYIYK